MHHVDAGGDAKQFGTQVRGTADAARGKTQLAGLGFRQCHQFSDRFRRYRRMQCQHKRLGADDGDCGDVALHVKGQVFVQRRCVGDAHALQQQRVAVGYRLGGDVGGDHAAAARTVVNDGLLAPDVGQFLRQQPRDDVGAAARGGCGQQAHRAFGKSCRGCGRADAGDGRESNATVNHIHVRSPPDPALWLRPKPCQPWPAAARNLQHPF